MRFDLRNLLRCAATALAVVTLACGRPAEVVEFADHAWHQSRQVTTDLISVPDGVGLDHVGFGWTTVEVDGKPSHLEMRREPARISFFSADGDVTALDLRVRRAGATDDERVRVRVRLNKAPLGRFQTTGEWRQVRLELPSGDVTKGWNVLEFEVRGKDSKALAQQTFDMERLRVQTPSASQIWKDRPQRIEVVGAGEERSTRLLMPSTSWIEAFIVPSAKSRFLAEVAVRAQPPDQDLPEDELPVEIYLALSDGASEIELLRKSLEAASEEAGAGDVEIDLEEWADRPIRLRLGVTGPGSAVVEWRDPRVTRARDALDEMAPLAARVSRERSSHLGRPHVVVIMLDAARADAFSPFGGKWATPGIERLADGGTVFEQAFAASSWTGQSVAATMTGLYPDSIGVGAWGSPLAADIPTLAELMSANGYRTTGWTHHPFYGVQRAMKRGFDQFTRVRTQPYEVPKVADLFGSGEEPTLAFVHLMPPHAPYEPPSPFRGLYTSDEEPIDVDAQALNRLSRSADRAEVSADDLEYARARYQENVSYADSLVGELLADLEAHGVYDESLVILLSDHGEAFYEHGEFLHTKGLFVEMLHVPFVIKWPAAMRGFSARVDSAVGLVDLVPTLVDGLGLEGGENGFQGHSLLPAVFDGESHEASVYAVTRGVASGGRAPQPWRALRAGGWKILHDELAGTVQLFDLDSDPYERVDLGQREPLLRKLFQRALLRQAEYNRQLAGTDEDSSSLEAMPEDVRKQLEALGYLN